MKKCFVLGFFSLLILSTALPYLPIQKYSQLYQNSVVLKISYLKVKLFLLSPVLGLPLAKVLSSGSQTPGSLLYAKGAARADVYIHVDLSLKLMLLIKKEWIKIFLLLFAKGKKRRIIYCLIL